MRWGLIRPGTLVGLLLVPMTLTTPAVSGASSLVLPGWDIFETIAPTQFMGIPLVGVPIGSHNFAGIGVRATDMADTIVRRLDNAGPGDPTALLMEALLLRTASDVNLGAGLGTYFVTLQSARGGPASTGVMDINFGPEPPGPPPAQPIHGGFNSTLNVFFDIRFGSPTGPIVLSDSRTLLGVALWSHFPPTDALEIVGVNILLNGQDRSSDFFPFGAVIEISPQGDEIHSVRTALVPEPASLLLLGSGLAAFGSALGTRRHRCRREQAAHTRSCV